MPLCFNSFLKREGDREKANESVYLLYCIKTIFYYQTTQQYINERLLQLTKFIQFIVYVCINITHSKNLLFSEIIPLNDRKFLIAGEILYTKLMTILR